MVDTVLFTNTDGEITLTTGDDYFLGEGITHYRTAAGDVLDINGTGNNDIFINGSVVHLGTGETINVDTTSSGVSIIVGATGSIYGSTDYRGITSSGDLTVVTNNGLITGGEPIILNGEYSTVHNGGTIQNTFASNPFQAYAIQIKDIGATLTNSGHIGGPRGVSFTQGGDITNTGTILATGTAISLTGSLNTTLVNTGAITSSEGDAVFGSTGVQAITNTGDILGDIDLGLGDDTIVNSGEITGLIEMGDNNDLLRNAGNIGGDVDMGAGVNKIFNSGLIDGDVIFGSGDDLFNMSGFGNVTGVVEGGAGDDTIIGGAFRDELYGGDDADFIRGRDGDDMLDGGAGQDVLRGGAGEDEINGGTDADVLYGNRDDDILRGNADDDELFGGNGDDELYGGNQNDLLYGASGDDRLFGGGNNDQLFGNRGDDILEGGSGIDNLYGGNDSDALFGGLSTDNLFGGNGSDHLDGGGGGDALDGGLGDDVLIGGLGADVFIFGLNGGNDVVVDYDDGSDQIDLSAYNFASANEAESFAVNVNDGVLFDFSGYGFDGTLFIEGTTKLELQVADYIL